MDPFESALRPSTPTRTASCRGPSTRPRKGFGEHFGWLDADGNDIVDEAEYNDARAMGIGEYGAIAASGRPGSAASSIRPPASWRFKKNLPFMPDAGGLRGLSSTW